VGGRHRVVADAREPRPRKSALEGVAKRFDRFRPAREVLTAVKAVPTRFVQLDHATKVGGWPVERFSLLHGPSNEGKTIFALGLVESFLERDHFALYIDAERTTPGTWVEKLMGSATFDHPGFFAMKPGSYEQTIAEVREFLNIAASARKAGKVPPDTAAIVVCDSLRKLVPKDLLDEIIKAEREDRKQAPGKKVTAGRDRGAQLKAKMNAAWMDELVPLLEHAQASFVAIAREMVDPEADVWAKRFGNDYKVGGGSAIYYDASLVVRIERAKWVGDGGGDTGEPRKVYGERHLGTIKKTKVGGKEDRETQFYFHTSNGVLVPEGYDRARDVVELARRFDIVSTKGSWLTWAGATTSSRWQGEHAAVRALSGPVAKDKLFLLETEVRRHFEEHPPVEITADGEVVER